MNTAHLLAAFSVAAGVCITGVLYLLDREKGTDTPTWLSRIGNALVLVAALVALQPLWLAAGEHHPKRQGVLALPTEATS